MLTFLTAGILRESENQIKHYIKVWIIVAKSEIYTMCTIINKHLKTSWMFSDRASSRF